MPFPIGFIANSNVASVLLLVGESGKMTKSHDGVTFSAVADSSFGSTAISDAAYSPSLKRFVAVGDDGKVAWSDDAEMWTQVTGTGTQNFASIVWVPELDLFVAGTSDSGDDLVFVSSDGKVWTEVVEDGDDFENFIDLAWSPSLGLLTSGLAVSEDAEAWTAASPGQALRCVDWAPGPALFLGGSSLGIFTSTDGEAWTGRSVSGSSPVFSGNVNGIAWSPELSRGIAVTTSGAGGTTTNGTSWSSFNLGIGSTDANDCHWSPYFGLFVFAGESGILRTSPDGLTFATRTSGFSTTNIRAITSGVILTA